MPSRIDAARSRRRAVARGTLVLVAALLLGTATASDLPDGPRGGAPAAASARHATHTDAARAPPPDDHPHSPLLWRALALAVGAGVAWGLYRLGRGTAPDDAPRRGSSR